MYTTDRNEDYSYPAPVITHHAPDNLTDGVIVPGLQALITAILTGFTAGALAAWVGWPYWGIGFTAACLSALISWLTYRARWAFILESVLGIDINRDGVIGEPEPPARAAPIRVEVIQENGRAMDIIDLPYPEKIPLLAAGLLQGKMFAQSVWTGQGALFSRNEFETIRAELLKRGLARWRKEGAPGQGVDLTPAGRAVFKRLAEYPPTLPDGIPRK